MAAPDDPITTYRPTLADKARVLGHPDEMLAHPNLNPTEKRELLAAWASDAHGVVDSPGLRQIDSGAIVTVDEILAALRALDERGAGSRRSSPVNTPRFERRRHPSLSRVLVALTRRDDDDDPPPSPAAALPPGLAYARRRRWESGDNPEPLAA